ncbi:hypothetical protein ASD06_02405 [Angustibacter sp. Root456]|nr:hypothetical protein ASD06_02405 [Angustibacter sp. Root456]
MGPRQRRALEHVTALSRGAPLGPGLRVTLHFHPDRLVGERLVLEALADDGRYRSQFETGTSNGGLTAHPGGDRWRWESRMFGGAYDDASASQRPVYGALNHRGRPEGGSLRFGSSHLRLRPEVLQRSTFCFPDSVYEPEIVGTAAAMELGEVVDAAAHSDDPLDDYVEAQVHGPVRLDRDAEALVLDPCYRATAVEDIARRLPCAVEWHCGRRLPVSELERHPEYRGPEFVELGARIADGGWLDGRVIGDAARTGQHDPQALKRVWHYVARFGGPSV